VNTTPIVETQKNKRKERKKKKFQQERKYWKGKKK
jgi:hypothetical protein